MRSRIRNVKILAMWWRRKRRRIKEVEEEKEKGTVRNEA